MASRSDSASRSDTFSRLLSGAINSIATYEGKTAPIVEEELGSVLHLAGKTIQRYKGGNLPPEPRTIEVLAEAAVQRGYLGREWLQRFLHAARYPFADKLLDRLCPVVLVRSRPPHVYENLPAPTYSQFVLREHAFADVIDGLKQRSAVVLVVGLGGNGKTSLAREVATRCLKVDDAESHFDAVVWVSDKDRPGTTNLSTVLDEIARTLDYPGFTQFAHDEKRYEVEQLLRRQRVLLVVDNFETITDGALLKWLLRLPEPSKAVVTSREYQRAWRSSWPVELRGMSEAEAQALVNQRLHALRLDTRIGDKTHLESLLTATGGNPKAIELALGLMKYERRPLQQVLDDLYAARGELFDDLFMRAWALLDEAARRVLLVMTFFPANASSEALSATADVQGFAFDRAIERLIDLALLDAQVEDVQSIVCYTLHPLVRAFARAQLQTLPDIEAAARQRWLQWYVQFVEGSGVSRYNFEAFNSFNPEEETTFTATQWALANGRYVEALTLANKTSYYYYVQGIWEKNLAVNRIGATAAGHLSDVRAEALLLAYYTQRLIMQDNMSEALVQLDYLKKLASTHVLPNDVQHTIQHTYALYQLACGHILEAEIIWEANLQSAAMLPIPTYQVITQLWIAQCLEQQHELARARTVAHQALAQAIHIGDVRSSIATRLRLASIELEDRCELVASALLEECAPLLIQYEDRPNKARYEHLLAKLHSTSDNIDTTRVHLLKAIDLFERLGMRREFAEARGELVQLEARAHVETDV